MNIIGTGLSGLVGSGVTKLLSPDFSFENLSLETGVDITQKDVLASRLVASSAPWVFHFAAKTDVDGCEKEKELGVTSEAWRINVEATESIIAACKQTKKRLLYISTDFVFDGTADVYTEEDIPNPQSWYAKTKYEGELRVRSLGESGLVIRIAFPYRAVNEGKKDFFHRMLESLAAGNGLTAPSDQQFVPTFIDDIARAIGSLVSQAASGIYHVVGSQALSPYEAGRKIAATFGYKETLVRSILFAKFYEGRAPRPFHANLSNAKIAKFGVAMSTFDEGLVAIAQQLV
ncbi:SDR family oxidoreductase [Candidatus Gottesmanbacteria bacterium]|nr:SDR family oxidoreductase [Candidatus Gottesmanbacteria bacterium]